MNVIDAIMYGPVYYHKEGEGKAPSLGEDVVLVVKPNGETVEVPRGSYEDYFGRGKSQKPQSIGNKGGDGGASVMLPETDRSQNSLIFTPQYYTPSVFRPEPMRIVETNKGSADASEEQPITVFDDGDRIIIRDERKDTEVIIPKDRLPELFGDLLKKPEYSGGPGGRGMSVMLPDADRVLQPLSYGAQYYTPSVFRPEPMRAVETDDNGRIVIKIEDPHGRRSRWVRLDDLEKHARGEIYRIPEYKEKPGSNGNKENVASMNSDTNIVDVLLAGCQMAGIDIGAEYSEMNSVYSASEGFAEENSFESGANHYSMLDNVSYSPVMLSIPVTTFAFPVVTPTVVFAP